MKMDDERSKKLFAAVKNDCNWLKETRVLKMLICKATNLLCIAENCAPFKFCLFFNRPEIRR